MKAALTRTFQTNTYKESAGQEEPLLPETPSVNRNKRDVNLCTWSNITLLGHTVLVLVSFILAALELSFVYTMSPEIWWPVVLSIPVLAGVRIVAVLFEKRKAEWTSLDSFKIAHAMMTLFTWMLIVVFLLRFQGVFTSNSLDLFKGRYDNNWPSLLDPRLVSSWFVIMASIVAASWNEIVLLGARLML
jgi:hypothetical protein